MGHQSMTPGGKGRGGTGRGRGSIGSGNSRSARHQSLSPKTDPNRKTRVSHQPIGHGKPGGRRSGGLGGFDLRPRSHKKPDCFITTACAEARGLTDDCEQLRVLRHFRDRYVVDLPDGSEVLAEYDEKAPRIVAAIRGLPPEIAEALWAWIYEQIEAAVELIGGWRFDSAYRLYAETCMELEAVLLDETDHPESGPTDRAALDAPAGGRSSGHSPGPSGAPLGRDPHAGDPPRKETEVEA